MPMGNGPSRRESNSSQGDGRPGEPFSFGILHLPDGLGRPGFLILGTTSGLKICVCFSRTLVRVIFALYEALKTDDGMPPAVRGWRSATRLAKAIASQDRYLLPVEPTTIIHYVCDINRVVRSAAEEQGLPSGDIDRLKIVSARIGWGYKSSLPRLTIAEDPRSSTRP